MIELCIVHPGTVSPAVWSRLAAYLPAAARMTVLELESVIAYWEAGRSGDPGELTVERLADRLRLELVPGGLRVLLGWGFGGVVAHALADRLAAHAIVLDGLAPGSPVPSDAELERRFAMCLGARRGIAVDPARPDLGRLRLAHESEASLRRVFAAFARGARRDHALTEAHAPPGRPLTVVKAARSLAPWSPALGWDAFAPAEVLASAGDHFTMLTEPSAVAHLAILLRRWLAPACLAA